MIIESPILSKEQIDAIIKALQEEDPWVAVPTANKLLDILGYNETFDFETDTQVVFQERED